MGNDWTTPMTDLYKLRKQAEMAGKRYNDLYNERTKVEVEQYTYKRQIYSMPCDTEGWTDDELASHIYHMHDDQGYIHLHGVPRSLLVKVHELVRDIGRRPRAEDFDD
jgi:hypothetical protein